MNNKKKIAVLALVVAGLAAFFVLDLGRFFSLGYLKQSQSALADLYANNPWQVVITYLLIYVAATGLSLPGAGTILTLAGGAIFGLAWGTLIVSFASAIGATLAFLAARFVLRDSLQARFGKRLAEINSGIAKDGAFYLFTLRLVPLVPFFVINLVMGLTKMRTRTFYWVSQLGMLAGTAVYVNAGTQLARLDSLKGILSPALLGSLVLLGIFPLLARKIVEIVKGRKVYARWAHLKPNTFDRNLIVIGAGAGGLVSAYIAAVVKAKVTLVEAHKMGGDCLNYGCVPSKALIKTARLAHQIQHGARYGLNNSEPSFSFRAVMKRVRDVITAIEPHDSVQRYASLGVEVLQGYAKITTPWTVEIALADGSTQTLTTRAIVIATGAQPFVPPLPGINDSGYVTSDTLWDEFSKLREIPKRMVVLGGGPIGCELAQCFARLGAQVTQVEMADRIMIREDKAVSGLARAALQADGVNVLTSHKALRCEVIQAPAVQLQPENLGTGNVHDEFDAPPLSTYNESAWTTTFGGRLEGANTGPSAHPAAARENAKILVLEHAGQEVRIEFDALLCAVGRVPRLAGYGLEELGIPTAKPGGGTIQTNEYLETIYPNIFAAGDVAGPYQFTHVAAHQAWYAAVNALFGSVKKFKVDYSVIPWATFIDPEVARVGLNEQEAAAQGIAHEVTQFDIDELDRQICDEGADTKTHGFVKVLTVPGKDKILGVTIVGTHAGDLLAEYVLAMRHGLGLNKILGTIHTYPTLAEANKYAAGEWKRAHQPEALLSWARRFHDWRRG